MPYPMATAFLRDFWRMRRLAPALVAACGLSACISAPKLAFAPPPIDPTSPIAKDIQAASDADLPYPRWADVPPGPPTDIRPATAWTRNIYDTLRLRREQEALAVLYPQTLFNADAFANTAKAQAVPPTPEQSAAQSEAKAKALRERATPPSPAN
jgi:hypothetical protein